MLKSKALLAHLFLFLSHITLGSTYVIHGKTAEPATVSAAFAPASFSLCHHHRRHLITSSLSMTPPSKEEEEAEAARVEKELQHGERQSALIIQNKGGGHGELGFQLAQHLLSSHSNKIKSITILQDDSCNHEEEPFKSYMTDLPEDAVTVVEANLAFDMEDYQLQAILGGREASFEYVWDNNSKGIDSGSGKAICDCAKSWNCKLFTYVSSAGIYQPEDGAPFPMSESTTPIKESSGQAQLESYAASIGLPLVSFRPQYIYGPKSNKWDYIDWYFDRLCRNQILPIPGDGTQKVSLTNSQDVASLLASPLNNEKEAVKQRYFNCGTDKFVSYDEVAKLCMDAAGITESSIKHYDASLGKAKFPFRLTDFYVGPDLAKEKLAWVGPKCTLKEDLEWYYELYKERGGLEKDVVFSCDEEVLGGAE